MFLSLLILSQRFIKIKNGFEISLFDIFLNFETSPNAKNLEIILIINLQFLFQVLRSTGLKTGDQQALLQMLMQLSGSIGHVQEAIELLKSLNFFGRKTKNF